MYIGVNNIAHKVNNCYVGVDGIARKVKAVYVGVDGKARVVWKSGTPIVSKLVSSIVHTKSVPGLGGSIGSTPYGYEFVQQENKFICNTKYVKIITVNEDGSISSLEKTSQLDNDLENYWRDNILLLNNNMIYSLLTYVDYYRHFYFDNNTKTLYTKTLYVDSHVTPVCALPDGKIMGIILSKNAANYSLAVMYPDNNNQLTYSSYTVQKIHSEYSDDSCTMLTPNKGIVFEEYNTSQKKYIRPFIIEGTTFTMHNAIDVTSIGIYVCLLIKTIDKNHFIICSNTTMYYFSISDDNKITLLDSLPLILGGSDMCRIGKTNSFVVTKTSTSEWKIYSFTDTNIIETSYTSSHSGSKGMNIFPFGNNGIIIFTLGEKSDDVKTIVETFE